MAAIHVFYRIYKGKRFHKVLSGTYDQIITSPQELEKLLSKKGFHLDEFVNPETNLPMFGSDVGRKFEKVKEYLIQ